MGCSSCGSGGASGISIGSGEYVTELKRVHGLEEANRLLADGHSFVGMYFNQEAREEVYILAELKPVSKVKQPIGFVPNK
ncbi:hypothetical protein [Desulforamulus aquiferis]|uniref:HMA domain-containing protein n=1 Tax=Desulforamulus aquiferis TaxID=1397668 RepID=A0AAW7Z9Y5_9FIRM|nr:hypothetical protein [Desulforamulus aquiferis]MDO7786454.1 hypothetical protein [Desulforamulus aquiferis]RYD06012.1 hypothetical protein N752_06540 [Desulforamulus aquiferis]